MRKKDKFIPHGSVIKVLLDPPEPVAADAPTVLGPGESIVRRKIARYFPTGETKLFVARHP